MKCNNLKCKKCGTVLAEHNYKNQICDNCKNDRINIIRNIFLVITIILTLVILVIGIDYYNARHPITTSRVLSEVSDKEDKITSGFNGKTVIMIHHYYLYLDNNEKIIRVSPEVYNDYNIGDLITVLYSYRDGEIIDIRYYR